MGDRGKELSKKENRKIESGIVVNSGTYVLIIFITNTIKFWLLQRGVHS